MEFCKVINVDERTADVKSTSNFASLMLTSSSVDALTKAGFFSPSPVQEAAIPIGLMGFDILVQAKSGTGKTLVFALMALENLNAQLKKPQVMILAPTREIVMQISSTIRRLAPPVIHIGVFVGGNRSVAEDVKEIRKGVQIIVCTTGRICQLVNQDLISTNHIRLFVLDEADKLMEKDFQKDINFLFSSLPQNKQVAVFSATYPRDLDATLAQYMTKAHLIRLNEEDVQLLGIKQYVALYYCKDAAPSLIDLLSKITFSQCLIFANDQQKCEHILNALQAADIDAELISGNMEQTERNRIMRRLKNFQLKILVSTDLTARGIDAENVNCVLNFGAPLSSETYLHRIGRAGRFGGYGIAITLLTCGKEVKRFMNLMETAHLKVKLLHLTQQYPRDLCNNQTFYDSSSFFKPAKKSAEEETTADNGTDVNSAKERSLLNDEIISMSQHEEVISKSALIYSARKLDCDPNELSEHGTLSDEMLQRVRNLEKIRQQKALKLNHEEEESHSYNDDPIESATSNGGSFLINTCPNSIKVEMESEKYGFVNGETILKNAMKSLKIDSEETTEATHSSLMVSSDYSRNDHCSPGQQSSAAINPILSVVSSSTEAQESAAVRQQLADDGLSGSLLNRPKSRFKRLTSSRAKQRQIITYLRGELLKIRNARTDSEWWNYVSAKYASSIPREIFVGNNQQVVSVVHATPSTSFTESSSSLLVQFENNREKVSRPISTTPSERTVYRRDEMLKIRKSRCAQEWSLWATQKWNTKEEPFQMDRELRVPFAERLRINREREKKTRNALRAKEEHKKVKRTDLLYSSARYPVCVEMPTTFDEYVVDFYKCVNEFEQKEVQNKRTGPVVRPLRKPQQYNEAVHNASVYLKNLKSSFWSEWNLKMDNIRDQSTSTEEDLLLGSRRDTVVQTDGEFVETTAKQNADVSHPVPGVCDKMDKGSVDHAENNFFTTSETDQNVECTKEQCDDEHLKLINCYYYYMNYYTERYFNQRKKTD